MISPATPIIGTGGTVDEVMDWIVIRNEPIGFPYAVARCDEVWAYLNELHRLCTLVGFDFRILAAQSAHETANWTSHWWRERLNPAGIGITGDPAQNEASPTFATGEDAARAQIVHMSVYLPDDPKNDTILNPYVRLDPRYLHVVAARYDGSVRVLGDLGNGRWAVDPDYAAHIARVANSIFKESPMPDLVFGNVPHPPCLDRPITKAEGKGQNDLGQRTVKGVTWHRMLGSLWGTDGYFRRADVNALTDYGVGVAAQDGPEHAGEIIKWNDPLGRQSGWASGVYSSYAYGDGAAFVAKYGVNAINRDRASIEISGHENTPLDDKSRKAIAALTAYWADQAKIPWDVFPIVPGDGFSFVCWHEEFGPEFGQKKCPFEVVKAETAALIERARQIMKQYQTQADTTPKPPTYAAPQLPEWWERTLAQSRPSDAPYRDVLWRVARRNVESTKRTQRYSEPDMSAKKSGPPVEVREKVYVERSAEIPYTDSKGRAKKRKWYLTEDGHYVVASGFTPDIIIRAR